MQTLWHAERVFACSFPKLEFTRVRVCHFHFHEATRQARRAFLKVARTACSNWVPFLIKFTSLINSHGSQEASALVAATETETPMRWYAWLSRSLVLSRNSSGNDGVQSWTVTFHARLELAVRHFGPTPPTPTSGGPVRAVPRTGIAQMIAASRSLG